MRNAKHKMFSTFLPAVVALFLTAMAVQVYAEPVTFSANPDDFSKVTFISTAKVETFEGTTNRIAGSFTVDPQDVQAGVSGKLEVDMTALTTGISQRDNHMRENHLNTDQFPRSSFVPTKVVDGSFKMLPDNESVQFTLEGEFTLHGVTHTIQPVITATWHSSQKTLDVTAKFSVRLEDYDIPLPQFLVLKLAQEQKVEIRFMAKAS